MKNRLALLLVFAAAVWLCACMTLPAPTEPTPTAERLVLPTERVIETVPTTEMPTTEAPLPPEFGTAPEPCDTALVINGKALPNCYTKDEMRYVRLADLLQPMELSFVQTVGEGTDHSCLLRHGKDILHLTPNTAAAMADRTVVALGGTPVFDGEDWYLPAEKLLGYYGFSPFEDSENNTVYYTKYPRCDSIPTGKTVPVLMYHAVSDYCWGSAELFVSPSVLDAQIAALLEAGYTPITFEDFDRLAEIEKPVMLTFDDGYDDNYDYLFPILQKYQVKATVFMIVNDIGKNHKLTEAELTEMSDSGLVSIQSHTMSHNYLSYMGESQLDHEMAQSKLALARLTGKEPFVLCYPTGMYSSLSLQKTAEYYEFGLLMSKGIYVTGSDPCMIRRIYVPRGLSAEGLLQKISGFLDNTSENG